MAGRTISGTALAELASASSATLAQPASSAALVQPASSAERAWPSNSANLMRPGNSAERARPGSSAALLRLAGSAGLVRPASGADEAGAHRILPVLPELSRLLPDHGLRRGSTVVVATGPSAPASGGTSLLAGADGPVATTTVLPRRNP